jgi:hypothetical protein
MEPIKKKRPIQAILMSDSDEQWYNILTGNKGITIRTGYRDYIPGLVMIVNPNINRCVEATITNVNYYLAKEVPEGDCLDDGFSGLEDMVRGMKAYYPEFCHDSEVTVIRWEKVKGALVDEVRANIEEAGNQT